MKKRKLEALNQENCEELSRRNLAQKSNVPRSQEDLITQVFEKNEGRVTKKLSQEFSRTEHRILGALSRLDGFLMKPLIQGHSGTAPETSRDEFAQTRERMRTTTIVILVLKQASSTTRRHETLAQKMATTIIFRTSILMIFFLDSFNIFPLLFGSFFFLSPSQPRYRSHVKCAMI